MASWLIRWNICHLRFRDLAMWTGMKLKIAKEILQMNIPYVVLNITMMNKENENVEVLLNQHVGFSFIFMFSSYLFLMEQFVEGYYLLRKIGRIKELFRKMFVWFVRGEFMN